MPQLLRPVNGDGKLCGVGELKDYPNLYYIIRKQDKDYKAVCVKQCPPTPTSNLECFGTSKVHEKDCINKDFYAGYGTIRVLRRFCVPDPDQLSVDLDDDSYNNIVGSFGLDDVSEFAQDIDDGAYVFVITFVTCILITVIYALLVYSLTGVIVWFTFAGTFFGLLGLAHLLKHHVRLQKKKTKQNMMHTREQSDPDRTGLLINIGVYVLYFLAFMLVICVACMWKQV